MEINDSTFEALKADNKPIVLDFWAKWCGPCRTVSPIIEELAKEYEETVNVGKVDIEEDSDDLVTQFGIRNVPTILFIKNGEVVDKVVGAMPKNVIEGKIKTLI